MCRCSKKISMVLLRSQTSSHKHYYYILNLELWSHKWFVYALFRSIKYSDTNYNHNVDFNSLVLLAKGFYYVLNYELCIMLDCNGILVWSWFSHLNMKYVDFGSLKNIFSNKINQTTKLGAWIVESGEQQRSLQTQCVKQTEGFS